ncbi:hypothetical protein Rmet_4802 (plasmid) [Cupriavidus metallidurans CH34]|uniref:Uncharacterized protein n=1 Tax=Cupriavidus metallidurans (strain ATCC 43123 / DSM 2839 / NBRC 102507 / CH34) TaxID=266264 RepID=Q1LDW2_CUPMC|nr:hypothetical protein Rmet_4802 [Cupriavidus metallidurans CH34]
MRPWNAGWHCRHTPDRPGPARRAFPGRAGNSGHRHPDLSFPARHFAFGRHPWRRNSSCILEKAMTPIYRKTICAIVAVAALYVLINS